jgi:hypothetical protein
LQAGEDFVISEPDFKGTAYSKGGGKYEDQVRFSGTDDGDFTFACDVRLLPE